MFGGNLANNLNDSDNLKGDYIYHDRTWCFITMFEFGRC